MLITICARILSVLSLIALAACGDARQESLLKTEAGTTALISDAVILPIVVKADLLAKIVSGAACPVNSREMVHYSITNRGNARAPASTLRLRIKYQGAVSYWYQTFDIGIASLAPGQSTAVGTLNGQTQVLRFLNGSAASGVRVKDWSIMVDDSGSVQESNELNNLLNAAGQCFPG